MRATVAVILSLLLLGGCAHSPAERVATAAPAADRGNSNRPPTGWTPTKGDQLRLEWAEDTLAGQCMRGLGFKYWSAPLRSTHEWDLAYVIDNVAWARTHGYGWSDNRLRDLEAERDPNRSYIASLSQPEQSRYETALFGPPGTGITARTPAGESLTVSDKGCLASARVSLYGDVAGWFKADTVVSNLQPLVARRTVADPGFRRAMSSWAACARRTGYSVSTPDDLQHRLADAIKGLAPKSADSLERRYAVVEAQCAVASGLGPTARAVDRRNRTDLERTYRGAVANLRALQYPALLKARELAGRPAGTTR